MILTNITRVHNLVDRVVSLIEESDGNTWNAVISAFVSKDYNQNAELHHLASVINNLSQSSCVRRYNLLDFCITIIYFKNSNACLVVDT